MATNATDELGNYIKLHLTVYKKNCELALIWKSFKENCSSSWRLDTMGFLALLMVVVLLSAIEAPAAAQDRLHCSDRCGNSTIPYPFGLDGCNLSPEFLITCNDSFNPPLPFLRKSNIKVKNITLDGKLEIVTIAARDCYNQSGARQPGFRRRILTLSNFTISKSQNKFTVIGCDSYAYLQGFRDGKLYSSGCMSVCAEREFVDDNSCSGSGCCQIEIPDGLYRANVTAYSFNNHTNVSDFNPCTYAFIVEDSKFNFSFKYLQNISNTAEFPMVLDWAIEDNNTHACKDHAQSYQPPGNISGYRCECKAGYQGNPYVGCQDINECENENECTDKCTNTDGNYTCSCPKGYHGDGRKDGQGCTPNQLSLVKITLVNPEETEYLLGEKSNDFGHGDDSTASAGYDSMKNNLILSVGDGR
ncbi:hypothetical protein GH714_022259 [Hevea brasiliensis]|uniref:EGF-like domain-containing protein n=1 Tax=Hevea brasiliensis TaxID=3981 RepID=A0A6A6KQR0_HEVBR|nr:hypothetical protein GH714_022259 [Hevea brasiliensis]